MKQRLLYLYFFALIILVFSCTVQKKIMISGSNIDNLLENIMKQHAPLFDSILQHKAEWNVQLIYTQVDRTKKGEPVFTDHYFNVDKERYYYPASTVKLPVAILALQKLNELKIPGLDRNSTMITDDAGERLAGVINDPSAADGRPTIAHYIKKILLVSDNDAFNRLYEFLGQEYINNSLHKMGYSDIQILHRLAISLTDDENRMANPVRFTDSTGKLLYEKPLEKSKMIYASRNTKMGKGFMKGDKLINEPFDFSGKNRFSLQDLHSIVRSIMFPDAVPAEQRFNLTKDDYDFLHRYMSMIPSESKFPSYNPAECWDTYVKFLFYGSEKGTMKPGIRIFNKVGDAYGFLIDGAYFADVDKGIEFFLSAAIYCNSDGIFNDDKYDYDTIGLPFMKNIGQAIYQYEMGRKRKQKPDLSALRFDYNK